MLANNTSMMLTTQMNVAQQANENEQFMPPMVSVATIHDIKEEDTSDVE